ncbi:hypothetical protein KQI42_20610 [Tissierella sp. MSJ-40]|uniref:Uncharacterized protein n=1 Tax=Tissierella simiarum TaxID=2841534 RepID=A0ABS6EBT9_9FIRM|nr:hypothetical protein [Tissierella simiarum]MBU5440399.1 hypothetical protein [Tissierella simiarum]
MGFNIYDWIFLNILYAIFTLYLSKQNLNYKNTKIKNKAKIEQAEFRINLIRSDIKKSNLIINDVYKFELDSVLLKVLSILDEVKE